ncbi:uncharacterized protein AMSG_10937 [Thecamonas trahens ATCC 50062]|uniref:PX domain-containing protein n=1 Tax=Thecamonas trahens ATCC 50062 TaxID=461836 RepID=A0A0L0DSQ0_THETB|nr:hypothetical protein AMSG_10937 [Thecamonas trahens ATCC 50062]KNC55295.1 hypothetical protein AMSG_10937 [Thecamonas trahens ATCC 50062]|eukprot:XP_013753115.1 hypothetical protein AMSG_10937 [Thecamonas trahens ATCC 50062]
MGWTGTRGIGIGTDTATDLPHSRPYSAFYALNEELKAKYGAVTVGGLDSEGGTGDLLQMLPPKALSPKVGVRARALARYVQLMMAAPGLAATDEVLSFFDVPDCDPPIAVVSIPTTVDASNHTLYNVVVRLNGPGAIAYGVRRRFSEFKALNTALTAAYNKTATNPFLNAFPPSKMFGKMAPSLVRERQAALEAYLKYVILHPVYGAHPKVISFCCVNAHRHAQSINRGEPLYDDATAVTPSELAAYVGLEAARSFSLSSHGSDT